MRNMRFHLAVCTRKKTKIKMKPTQEKNSLVKAMSHSFGLFKCAVFGN